MDTLRCLREDEAPDPILELFQRCFHRSLAEEDWSWKYRRNPHGPAVVVIAQEEDGVILGHYALVPRRWLRGGREVTLYQEVDLMVEPGRRGRGLFAGLADAAYREMEHRDVPNTFGFPNQVSTPIGTRRLGWRLVCPIPVLCLYARPLRLLLRRLGLSGSDGEGRPALLPRMLHPSPPGQEVRSGLPGPDELDDLWQRVGSRLGGAGVRDGAYVHWRYAGRPGAAYQPLAVRGSAGELLGMLIWRHLEESSAGIVDLWAEPGDETTVRALVGRAVQDATSAGADAIRAWSLPGPFHALLRSMGFLPRQAGIHHVVRPFGGPERVQGLLRPGSWYLAWGDGDSV